LSRALDGDDSSLASPRSSVEFREAVAKEKERQRQRTGVVRMATPARDFQGETVISSSTSFLNNQ
jgi:hypothetical protein